MTNRIHVGNPGTYEKSSGTGTINDPYIPSVAAEPEALDHTAVAISGQNTVASAGTAEALGSQVIAGPLSVKALTTNTGLVYVGNDGADDVTSSNGFPLAAGDERVFDYVGNLSDLYIDSAVNGEGVAWIALGVK